MARRYTVEERRELVSAALLNYGSEPFPSFAGACRLAGVEPTVVMGWLKRDDGAYEEYLRARGRSEAHWLDQGLKKNNPVFSIFCLKTQHGDSYTERVGVDVREWKFESEGKAKKGKDARKGKL